MKSNRPQSSDPIASTFATAEEAAIQASQAAIEMGNLAGNAFESASQTTQQLLERATQAAGSTLSTLANNPILKFMTDKLGAGWLKTILGGVDVEKVRARVKKLQQQYPQETPSQIAHRLIVDKALFAAGVGFATNIIPPIAAALLGVELAATAVLQAEMVYEIAAAYNLDLTQPARRGEVVAIFGLALGTDALKAGLGLVEIIPGVGAVVGASSNAVMFYALGFAANRFYEAKCKSSAQPVDGERLRAESEAYSETLLTQRDIMDRILVHMILASYPGKSWSEILPDLQSMNLSSTSIAAIARAIEKPQPLNDLLDRLEPDFGVLLLAQCDRIARRDGVVTDEEAAILEAIRQRLPSDDRAIAP